MQEPEIFNRERYSIECGKGVVLEIAPGIGLNCHPSTPLGALAVEFLGLGMNLSTVQC